MLIPITFVALSHQWTHLSCQVSIVACRVCHQVINTIDDLSLPGLQQHLPALWKASHEGGQKRTLYLLEVKLQTVMTHYVGFGMEPRSSERIKSALDAEPSL